jgi:hypothetical protein
LWDNVEKYGASQATGDSIIRRMRYACWTTTATHTHTLRICNIYCSSTAKKWLRERASMLRYIYIACVVSYLMTTGGVIFLLVKPPSLTTHLHLVRRLRMRGVTPHRPPYAFMVMCLVTSSVHVISPSRPTAVRTIRMWCRSVPCCNGQSNVSCYVPAAFCIGTEHPQNFANGEITERTVRRVWTLGYTLTVHLEVCLTSMTSSTPRSGSSVFVPE